MLISRAALSATAIGLLAAQAHAQAYVEVSQESSPGAGDFDCHILGVLRVWETTKTASEFYNYDTVNSVSWGGAWTYGPIANQSNLMVVQASDGLSLVILHDQPGVSNGGGTANTRVDIVASATPISRVVEDDPGERYTGNPGSSFFAASHDWSSPNTDGYVLRGFSGSWTATVSFTESPTSLSSWIAASDDGGAIPLVLESNRRVRVRATDAPVPNSLLALYTYDDGKYRDLSGRNHHAYKPSGSPKSPLVVPGGHEGQCLALAPDAWLRVDLDIGPTNHPVLTMGGWAKRSTASGFHAYLHHGNGGSNRSLVTNDIASKYGWGAGDGTGTFGPLSQTAELWQFVACVYDAGAGTLRLHVDGVEIEGSGNPPAGNPRLFIGLSPNNGNGHFNGVVDNTFVIAEALTKSRLDEIRTGGYHRIPTQATIFDQPRCDSPCDGGEALFVVDAGGSGGVSFQWRREGVPLSDGPTGSGSVITGTATNTLLIQSASVADEADYDCVVTNTFASTTSVPASLIICYADCDCSGTLNIDDFICFQTTYAIGDPAADCDADGTLNIDDFICFQTLFAVGC
jgi:Concanavalin A-like lectin/glucanases superfamily/Immunoglobulin I-set domain